MKKLFLLLLCLSAFTAYSQTKTFIDLPYIEVTGIADTFIVPNEIFIKITISEKDSRDRISVEQQEANLIAGLNSLGINTEKELSVFDFGSNYRFYLLKKKDVIKTKEYTLKVSDAVTVSKVFMKLEELDLSNAYIARVDHTEMETFRNKARTMAVLDAKSKALSIVQPIGQSIGNAIFISDNEQKTGSGDADLLRNPDSMRFLARSDKYKAETSRLEFEKIKVSSFISVKFILK